MLLSTKAEKKVYELARTRMTYLELSTEPGYMDDLWPAASCPIRTSGCSPTCSWGGVTC